jgi:rare lipoprotein A
VLKHTVIRASFVALTILFAGCASKQVAEPPSTPSGGYYKDDGPAAATPSDVDKVPDAEPRDEPLHRFANRPYNVFGVDYTPMTQRAALTQRGVASWYGRKFHGQKTAIGETYDMFAMSAAHPTAPLPSYAQVTNPRNGKTVVVRINDRGPFLNGRIVDLSYAAASRIGIVQVGSGEVTLDLLLPPYNLSTRTPRSSVAAASPIAATPTPPIAPPTAPIAPNSSLNGVSGGGTTQYFVQLAAFGNFANAQTFQQRMTVELNKTPLVKQAGGLFRVQLGPFASAVDAQTARDAAQQRLNTSLPILTVPSP